MYQVYKSLARSIKEMAIILDRHQPLKIVLVSSILTLLIVIILEVKSILLKRSEIDSLGLYFEKTTRRKNEKGVYEYRVIRKQPVYSDSKKRTVWKKYNQNKSGIDWWKKNISTLEGVFGCRYESIEIIHKTKRQSYIILHKECLPKKAGIIKDLAPYEFNFGATSKKKSDKLSLKEKSSIIHNAPTGAGKTTHIVSICADLAHSTKPIFVISAPKGIGDWVEFRNIYEDTIVIDTSTVNGMKLLLEHFKETERNIKRADHLIEEGNLPVTHHLELPKHLKYRDVVYVLDDYSRIMTKGPSGEKERNDLVEQINQFCGNGVREYRSKLCRFIFIAQEAKLTELKSIPFSSIGIKFYGFVRSHLAETTGLDKRNLERKDLVKGKFIADVVGREQQVIRAPFYGELKDFKPWHPSLKK